MTSDARFASRTHMTVDELAGLARHHAADADASGRLRPEVIDGVRSAGFARHFVAATWGGTEGSFLDLTRSVIAVGQACPSTAWVASIAASSARFASHLPVAGQARVWHEGPDAFIVTALVPSGQAVPVRGGWQLTGCWEYVSGVEFADWALVCAPVAGDGDPPELRFFAVPRGGFEIRESWDSIGMRATGSHGLTVDAFVPLEGSFPRTEILSGRNSVSKAPCHNVPFRAAGGLVFVAPITGAVTGALHAATAMLADKRRTPSTDLELVRTSARIDAMRLVVEENARVVDAGRLTPVLTVRNQRNAAFVAEQAAQAANHLLRVTGTSGLSEKQPIQRFWRDVIGMTSHVALRFETSSVQTYLPVLFGEG